MKMHHSIVRAAALSVSLLIVFSGTACPPNGEPPDPDPEPDPIPPVTVQESEPNNELTELMSSVLASGDHVRVTGSIAEAGELDLYDLGPMAAGDRIVAKVNADNSELDPVMVIFDIDADLYSGNLFATDDEPPGLNLNPLIAETFRHSADRYILGISASYTTLLTLGDYTIDIKVERGGQVPAPRAQHVVVNFEGGSATSIVGTTFTIDPFDPSEIDATYIGMEATIRTRCLEALRENFRDYHVTITSSDQPLPADGIYSVVHIGQVANTQELAGAEGLGIAIDGVDNYNADPRDDAVIFVNNFVGATFGLLQPLKADELAVALANVASHEIGHMLGLNHTFDPASPMNTLDAASTLLLDQRFKRSLLFFGIFEPLNNVLQHNSDLLLRETVGGLLRLPDATIGVGQQPLAATTGDMDGDGDADVLVVNRSDRSVSLLTNDGSGNLAVTSTIPLSGPPIDIRVLDLDGDGDPDAAVTMGATDDVGFLINDGFGALVQASETLTVAEGPFGLDAGDLDGDGDQDLAVVSLLSNKLSVLTNHQTGGAEVAQVLDVGAAPRVVCISDLDADGAEDILTTNTEGKSVSILYGRGDGSFEDAVSIVGGSLPLGLDTGDADGDGDEDIIVTSSISNILTVQFSSNVSVMLNQGGRSFAPGRDYLVGAFAQAVAVDDLDNDGDLDLAVACGGDLFVVSDHGQLSVLFNRGDGTYAQDFRYEAGSEPFGVLTEDLNGDGASDIVVVGTTSNDVSVFLNQGQGEFGRVVDDNSGAAQSKPIHSKLLRRERGWHTFPGFVSRAGKSKHSYCLTCSVRK